MRDDVLVSVGQAAQIKENLGFFGPPAGFDQSRSADRCRPDGDRPAPRK